MAIDAIDAAVTAGRLSPAGPSATVDLKLVGAERFDLTGAGALQERGFPADVASHLHLAYGDRAGLVADLATDGLDARLAEGHPYVEAEVVYAVRSELAVTGHDVLHRRTRLAFLDTVAAEAARARVDEIVEAELG